MLGTSTLRRRFRLGETIFEDGDAILTRALRSVESSIGRYNQLVLCPSIARKARDTG